jgi:hypothetical protein
VVDSHAAGATGPAGELYRSLLRAVVRRTALGDNDGLPRLAGALSGVAPTERLWAEDMYWSHRSPLLVADQVVAAADADLKSIAPSFVEKCRSLAAAGSRRNALLMEECASVLTALGPCATPLKGAWLLRHDIYPSKARMFGDLDFAIDPGMRPREVVAAFRSLGYEYRSNSTPDHMAFQRVLPDMRLYDGLPALREPTADFEEHYARIQRTFFAEAHYDIDARRSLRRRFFFGPEDRTDAARHLLLLAHHVCKHEFAHAIGMIDIALLAASPTVDWGRLSDLCRRFGALDICAAGLGIVAECFGPDMLPAGAAPFLSRRAARAGATLGWGPALDARASARGRWLSVRLSRSLRATYGSGMKALAPHIPKRFPLRAAHRRVIEARSRRRAAGLPDA